MRILLIEDDTILGEGIKDGLELSGETVDWVRDGEAGLHAALSETFDVIILDLGLPRLDGLTVLKRLRDQRISTPVLILTARDQTPDRVSGLDAGADDYLVKPFAFEELHARLRALTRRGSGTPTNTFELGPVRVDLASRQVWVDDQPVTLSRREYALLEELIRHRQQVLTKSQLAELVYGWEDDPESNALEVHIHHLRKKLRYPVIRTVRGVGYGIDPAYL